MTEQRRERGPTACDGRCSLDGDCQGDTAERSAHIIFGDARRVLADLDLEVEPSRVVVVTDPVWPNAPAGMFPGVEDPAALFADVAQHFPRLARRAVVQLGCASDPRFLAGVPASMPYVRTCWLRFAVPSYLGTILGTGDVAYVFGSNEGPEGRTVLPGEHTSISASGRDVPWHPCPRKLEHVLWLLRMFTRRDDVVLDPFAGSATTAIAAMRLGRRFVGVEASEEYVTHARERLRIEADLSTPQAAEAGQVAMFPGHKLPATAAHQKRARQRRRAGV